MSSPGFYFRPGLSVISVMRAATTSVTELQAFMDAHLPHVEQLCLAVDGPELLKAASAGGPKVACRMLCQGSPPERWVATQLADHAWSFWLEPHEHISGHDYAVLRSGLPHAGRARLAIGMTPSGQPQVRLWRTGWNLAPDGTGQLADAGPALMRPRLCKMVDQIPIPAVEPTAALARAPQVQSGPVLVTGMHRSGTSTVSGVLHLLGIALGDQLSGVHTEPHESNKKGHWEDLPGVALNTKALEIAQGLLAPFEWVIDLVLSENEARSLHLPQALAIVSRLATRGRWGFKDPRTCLTLPLWRMAAPNACLVLCVRDPLAAARSLQKRDSLPLVDGLRLWRAYNQRVLESAGVLGMPLIVLSYERLLSALGSEVTRLAAFVGCTNELDVQRHSRIDAFVEAHLRHYERTQDLREAIAQVFGPQVVEGEIDAIVALDAQLQKAATLPVELRGLSQPAQLEHQSY